LRDGVQQFVAQARPDRVVHLLEAVQPDVQDHADAAVAPGVFDRPVELPEQRIAVRQAGELVRERGLVARSLGRQRVAHAQGEFGAVDGFDQNSCRAEFEHPQPERQIVVRRQHDHRYMAQQAVGPHRLQRLERV
jgi:hypothetical protein